MRLSLKLFLAALAVFLLAQLGGCSCGFDCNNDSVGTNSAFLTLGLSDSLPEDLQEVVIEVESITFRHSDGSDVIVEDFSLPDDPDAATFHVDLLLYRGNNNLVVIDKKQFPTGDYDSVEIKLVVGSLDNSYVEVDDTRKEITVANNGVLQLPGMQLSAGNQHFVVEFGLAQALSLATDGRYLLSNTGVRIENTATDATLSGQVDSALFNSASPCNEKATPEVGNRVYIYQRTGSTPATLGDVFTTASTPTTAQAPFAVASLVRNGTTGFWEYAFGYLPAGDYTLAFACNTQADDAINFNGLVIPLPANQRYPITLTEGKPTVCNLRASGSC